MLEFRELRAAYDGVETLHGVSAHLAPGKLTAIIGPNGCGKSTLMKCAVGLMKPSGGEILLNGQALSAIPEKERARHLSYMPQSRIAPDISVRHLVTHGRYPHLKWGQSLRREDREIVQAAIERVKLGALANRPVSRLSGGERQRAYLAMMLAQQTAVMLLDEPTAYLDLSSQFALMELLRALCREGRSVILVLHELSLALEYTDSLLLMERGRLVAAGSPEEVYRTGQIQRVFSIDVRRTSDNKYLFYTEKQEVRT